MWKFLINNNLFLRSQSSKYPIGCMRPLVCGTRDPFLINNNLFLKSHPNTYQLDVQNNLVYETKNPSTQLYNYYSLQKYTYPTSLDLNVLSFKKKLSLLPQPLCVNPKSASNEHTQEWVKTNICNHSHFPFGSSWAHSCIDSRSEFARCWYNFSISIELPLIYCTSPFSIIL